MYNTLTTNIKDGILEIAINRPDKMNALNQELMKDRKSVV